MKNLEEEWSMDFYEDYDLYDETTIQDVLGSSNLHLTTKTYQSLKLKEDYYD